MPTYIALRCWWLVKELLSRCLTCTARWCFIRRTWRHLTDSLLYKFTEEAATNFTALQRLLPSLFVLYSGVRETRGSVVEVKDTRPGIADLTCSNIAWLTTAMWLRLVDWTSWVWLPLWCVWDIGGLGKGVILIKIAHCSLHLKASGQWT